MCAIVVVTYVKNADCSLRSHQAGAMPVPPVLVTSRSVIHGAGLPRQPDCQKIGTSRIPAAVALVSSWSSSVKSNAPCEGSSEPHGMLSSALLIPLALSAAKSAVDQGVPLLSNCSWVAQSSCWVLADAGIGALSAVADWLVSRVAARQQSTGAAPRLTVRSIGTPPKGGVGIRVGWPPERRRRRAGYVIPRVLLRQGSSSIFPGGAR